MFKKISFLIMLVFVTFISSCTVSKENNIIQGLQLSKKKVTDTEVELPVKPEDKKDAKKEYLANLDHFE